MHKGDAIFEVNAGKKKSDQEQVKKNVTDGLANKQNDIRTDMRDSELRSGLYYM